MNGSSNQLRILVESFRRAVGNRGGVVVTHLLKSRRTNLDEIISQVQLGNFEHIPLTTPEGIGIFTIGYSSIDSRDVIG